MKIPRRPSSCVALVWAAFAFLLCAPMGRAESAYTRLVNFSSELGIGPGGLFLANDGLLYGSTGFGGTSPGGGFGAGTIFRIAPDGTGFETLHVFTSAASGTDGAQPSGVLVEGSDGRLYGVCFQGGLVAPGAGGLPAGTIFRINKNGTGFQTVKLFEPASGTSSASTTGQRASAGLVAGSDGKLYGFTGQGGTSNAGVLYSLTLGEGVPVQTVLFNFASQGLAEPVGLPVEGPDGLIYGIARQSAGAFGALFRIQKNGSGFQLLHAFTSTEQRPASLVRVNASTLAGTSFTVGGTGSVFFTYAFAAAGADGYASTPLDTDDGTRYLTLQRVGSDGKIYGDEGLYDFGISLESTRVVRLAPDGTGVETVRVFSGADGTGLGGSLVEVAPLAFVGTTVDGGTGFSGTLFRLDEGPGGSLPSSIKAAGPKKIRTSKGRVKIAGKSDGGSGFVMEFRVGTKGKFKRAKGTAKWSFVAKVKPGKTFVFVRAALPDGTTSRELKLTVIRK